MPRVITAKDWVEAGNELEEIAPHAAFAFADTKRGMEPLEHYGIIELEPDEIVDDYWFKAYADGWLETFHSFVCCLDGSRYSASRPDTVLIRLRDDSEEFSTLEYKISKIAESMSCIKSHYVVAGIETLPIAEELGYLKGLVFRHLVRAGKKQGVSEIEDLKAARGFLDVRITALEKGDGN